MLNGDRKIVKNLSRFLTNLGNSDWLNYNEHQQVIHLLLNGAFRKEAKLTMALSKQERKEMARKAMEKRGNKKPDGSGFAKLDEEAKKLSD